MVAAWCISCRPIRPDVISPLLLTEDEVRWFQLIERVGPGVVVGRRHCTIIVKNLALPIPAFSPPFTNSLSARVSNCWATEQSTAGVPGRMGCAIGPRTASIASDRLA